MVLLSDIIVCRHRFVSLNNENICRENTEDKIAVCEKTAGLRSGKFSALNSACSKVLVPIKKFQFQDMGNENRFLGSFRGHSKRPKIRKRQTALAAGNHVLFKYYRNLINRNRKRCREVYHSTKVACLKDCKPKHWWNEVKRISGHSPVSNRNNTNIESSLPTEIADQRSCDGLADFINESFLEPQQMS